MSFLCPLHDRSKQTDGIPTTGEAGGWRVTKHGKISPARLAPTKRGSLQGAVLALPEHCNGQLS